ncbi:hypothetical protein M231_06651 [Tremella mesenterica]|uniref:Uncharacterized protein n=1 Tax=Tremella mesenterica TaxID=5217 RepID=A0A4Q1BG83_TREME|nr:hypothetical protein M231_06651 [Tremella mesenterica]
MNQKAVWSLQHDAYNTLLTAVAPSDHPPSVVKRDPSTLGSGGSTATLVTEYVEAELDLGEGLKIATRSDVMAYEGPEVLVGLDFLKQFRASIDCGKGLIKFIGIGRGWAGRVGMVHWKE